MSPSPTTAVVVPAPTIPTGPAANAAAVARTAAPAVQLHSATPETSPLKWWLPIASNMDSECLRACPLARPSTICRLSV